MKWKRTWNKEKENGQGPPCEIITVVFLSGCSDRAGGRARPRSTISPCRAPQEDKEASARDLYSLLSPLPLSTELALSVSSSNPEHRNPNHSFIAVCRRYTLPRANRRHNKLRLDLLYVLANARFWERLHSAGIGVLVFGSGEPIPSIATVPSFLDPF